MTNEQAYHFYMRDVHSAQLYVDWGWYFLISSALQRRVWLSGAETAIFPNMFAVFTGPPGTGKSLVCNTIKNFLSEHVRYVGKAHEGDRVTQLPLFPIAADSTTFESLVEETFNANSIHQIDDNNKYYHQSILFILDELASIFKQNAEDTTTFLLTTYSGTKYVRKTRHKGHFVITRPCLGMLACTVVDSLRELIRRHILDTGLAARTIFVHAQMSRFRQILIPERNQEQLQARSQLIEHLQKLSTVYGRVDYAPGVLSYLQEWWEDRRQVVRNNSPTLANYYERKALHVNKLAMTCLFMEQHQSMLIEKHHVDRAIQILNEAENTMHLPLSGGGRNELYTIALDVLEYIRAHKGSLSELEVVAHFLPKATGDELLQVFSTLEGQGKLARTRSKDSKIIYTCV